MLATFIARNYTNVLGVAECIAPLVACSFTLIKYLFLLINSEEIFDMIKEIKELNGKWKNTKLYSEIEKFNALDRRLMKVMEGFCIASIISYILPPMINHIYISFILNEENYDMPYKTDYFYDIFKYRAYEMTFFIQACLGVYAATLHVLVDTLFFGLCMNVCAHLKIIRQTMNERSLKETVSYHNRIFDLIAKMNKVFSAILFGEYAFLSLLLGVNGFLIVMTNDISIRTACCIHGTTGVIELLIYSYSGQKIIDYGQEICDDCYEIDKNYLIVMLRTKHKLRLYSLMYDACLPTVTLIMNRVMAMITLLRSLA
ncbi:unnamed protein product [Chironomus riparius]|uniref:Odorant receptor n=1 Tax=Chironomus riparius TaxID=315576 RepID=A0A9N9WQK0_9DIPT|nr:unnamed protein product [Chironomus riparius]